MRSGATIGPIAEEVRAGEAADRVPLKTASCPVGFETLMAAETGVVWKARPTRKILSDCENIKNCRGISIV